MTGPGASRGGCVRGRRGVIRAVVTGGLGLAGLHLLGACAPRGAAPEELPPYSLRPGDRIAVTVHDHPELSAELDLDADGLVRLPLAGTVSLAGLTVRTAETRIAARLEGIWVREASVTVALVAHAPVFVLGEVRQPGRFPYRPGMTVLEAVALAGGYTYRARTAWVTIRRPDRTGQLQQLYGMPGTPLLPGDGIDVPERVF